VRWAALYLRSRQVPAAAAGLLVAVCGARLLAWHSWSPPFASLAVTAGVAVAAIGLSGQDVDLDRTAALPWPIRRLTHLMVIGVVAGAVVLAVQRMGGAPVGTWLVIRDSAGAAGLAGLAATVAGGQFGWTIPLLWFAVALFVPETPPVSTGTAIAAWQLQPTDSVAANCTALAATATGLVAYMRWGGRK
jgi:hypothetical protein